MAEDTKIDFQPDTEHEASAIDFRHDGDKAEGASPAHEEKSLLDAIMQSPLLKGAQIGTTVGFSDELAGAAGALGGKFGGDERPIGDIYREARDDERSRIAQAREESPRQVMLGELAGGALALPFTGTGVGAAGRVGAAAGLGGSEADLTQGDNLGQAIEDTGRGAALGTGLGVVSKLAPSATAAAGLGGIAGGLISGSPTGMAIGAGLGLAGLGAGKGAAALAAKLPATQLGSDISRGYQLGKEGTSLIGKAPIENAEKVINGLSDDTTQALRGLESTKAEGARQNLSQSVDTALTAVGQRLGKSGEDLVSFMQEAKGKIGQDIQDLMAEKAKSGATVDVSDIVGALQGRLDELVMALPEDIAAKQNVANELQKYLVKNGVPVQMKTTRMLSPEGGVLSEANQLSGKNIPLEELAGRDISSEQGVMTPKSASITERANAEGSPRGAVQQEVSTFTPQEPITDMPIGDAQRLRKLLGQIGFGDKKAPDALRSELARAYPEVTERIGQSFETPQGNPFTEANRKYTALSQAGDIVGEPIKDYLEGGAALPNSTVQKLITGVGKAVREGDKANYRRLIATLKEVDPAVAAQLDEQITQQSSNEAALMSARKASPEQQVAALKQAGMSNPMHDEALNTIADIDALTGQLGVDTSATPLPLPSSATRNFIADAGLPVEGRSQVGRQSDIGKTLDLLRKYEPELATKIETEGAKSAEVLRLTGKLSKERSGSPVGRLAGSITQIPVSAANITGQVSRSLNAGPISGIAMTALTKKLPQYASDIQKLGSEDTIQRQAALFTLLQRPEVREALKEAAPEELDFKQE